VEHAEARRDDAARRVDVEADVLVRVFAVEVEELGDDQAGDLVVDRRAEKDDALAQEQGVNVEDALGAPGRLDDAGDDEPRWRLHGLASVLVAGWPSPLAPLPPRRERGTSMRYCAEW